MKISKNLESSHRMLRNAYPSGVPEADYYPLLALLYGEFSDRNLAEVISSVTGKDSSAVYNDIARSKSECLLDSLDVSRIENILVEHGFEQWKLED